jgi:hypothetical protein
MMAGWFLTQRMEVFTGLTSPEGARRMSTAPGFSLAVATFRKGKGYLPGPVVDRAGVCSVIMLETVPA